jgi:hypothetical protein
VSRTLADEQANTRLYLSDKTPCHNSPLAALLQAPSGPTALGGQPSPAEYLTLTPVQLGRLRTMELTVFPRLVAPLL